MGGITSVVCFDFAFVNPIERGNAVTAVRMLIFGLEMSQFGERNAMFLAFEDPSVQIAHRSKVKA